MVLLNACRIEDEFVWKSIKVNVTAYNSVPSQTDSLPNIAAWGDTLKPHLKSIAVSRDLINLGMTYNTLVKIEGLEGVFLVKDKTNPRFSKRIDIFMGNDVQKAKNWGRKKLTVSYRVKRDSLLKN